MGILTDSAKARVYKSPEEQKEAVRVAQDYEEALKNKLLENSADALKPKKSENSADEVRVLISQISTQSFYLSDFTDEKLRRVISGPIDGPESPCLDLRPMPQLWDDLHHMLINIRTNLYHIRDMIDRAEV